MELENLKEGDSTGAGETSCNLGSHQGYPPHFGAFGMWDRRGVTPDGHLGATEEDGWERLYDKNYHGF